MFPEIGYHIHKKYWHKGFAKEAARVAREGEELDYEDIEDAVECLIHEIPYAGLGEYNGYYNKT